MDSLSHLHERSKWTGPNGPQGNPTQGTDRPKYVPSTPCLAHHIIPWLQCSCLGAYSLSPPVCWSLLGNVSMCLHDWHSQVCRWEYPPVAYRQSMFLPCVSPCPFMLLPILLPSCQLLPGSLCIWPELCASAVAPQFCAQYVIKLAFGCRTQAKGSGTTAPTRIPVPPGTVVKRKRGGTLIADLTHPGHAPARSVSIYTILVCATLVIGCSTSILARCMRVL